MTLKVIGTGFGRTGTDSMRMALNILGFGPAHHMFEISDNPVQGKLWRDLVLGTKPNWDKLFEGYSSCVDWPSAYYWRELIDIYPDAKVLLTWRSAESWWTSFENTILKYTNAPDNPDNLFSQVLVGEKVFGSRPVEREHAISVYEDNVKQVIETVPEERLLIYKIGDGWEPLCRHLDVSVPDEPFPNRNSPTDFHNKPGRTPPPVVGD